VAIHGATRYCLRVLIVAACHGQEVFGEGRRTVPRSTTQAEVGGRSADENMGPMVAPCVSRGAAVYRRPVVLGCICMRDQVEVLLQKAEEPWRCVRGCSTTMQGAAATNMPRGGRVGRRGRCPSLAARWAVVKAVMARWAVTNVSVSLAVHQRLSWLAGPSVKAVTGS
jgi:hypothetical protein